MLRRSSPAAARSPTAAVPQAEAAGRAATEVEPAMQAVGGGGVLERRAPRRSGRRSGEAPVAPPGADEADAAGGQLLQAVLAARRLAAERRRVRQAQRKHLLAADQQSPRRPRRCRRGSLRAARGRCSPQLGPTARDHRPVLLPVAGGVASPRSYPASDRGYRRRAQLPSARCPAVSPRTPLPRRSASSTASRAATSPSACSRSPRRSRRSFADRSLLGALTVDGANAPPLGRRRRLQPRPRAAAALGEGGPAHREGGEAAARRVGARRHRHPRPAREAGVHDADVVSAVERSSSGAATAIPRFRELIEPQHCYVCKQRYRAIHPFYDQLCPDCGDFNFAKRSETADLRGPRGAAHRRARQDRLPGRDQAAAGRRAADRDDALPARRGGALRAASRTSRTGATGSRSSASTCATRRASRPSAATSTRARPARLRRQQRLPDRPPAARLLPPHDGARDGVGRTHAGARAAAARRRTKACGARTSSRPAARRPRRSRLAGRLTRRPSSRRCRSCRTTSPASGDLFPEGQLDAGPAAGRPARPELVAAAARRGLVGRAARDAARQRRRAVRPQRAPQAADAADAGPRQAHRQRVGGGGAVLPHASRPRGTRTRTWPRRR